MVGDTVGEPPHEKRLQNSQEQQQIEASLAALVVVGSWPEFALICHALLLNLASECSKLKKKDTF